MKHLVIGTAGHIDHGKTVLTRALTGVDTDRLPEEKAREMSIDLGFAPFPLSDDLAASIVDVPGHERFVKNMVAGVTGVDLILFVVAADDGVMPQTQEHLQILELLGLKHGVVLISKTDAVSPDRVKEVEDETRELLKNTFLERAPVVPVSAAKSTGIEALKAEVVRITEEIAPRRFNHILRLPVDRIFRMAGFGTVVTGTLIAGRVEVGQEIEVLPHRRKSRVRAIQVHQASVDQAVAGQRTALNLKDIGKRDLQRGDVITSPGVLEATALIDVKLRLLKTAKRGLKHLARVRFHVGTSEIMGRIILLESKELLPGNETFAQVRLDRPVVTLRKDRFILRSYSPQATIGGGTVLHAYPPPRSRSQPGVTEDLTVLDSSEDPAAVEHMLKMNPPSLTRTQLMRFTNVPGEELDQQLRMLQEEEKVVIIKNRIVHTQRVEEWKEEVRRKLKSESQGRIYVSKGEFIQTLPISGDQVLAELVLKQLETEGVIEVKAERIKLSARLDDMGDWKNRIEAVYKESEYQPPGLDELKSRVGAEGSWVQDLLSSLVDDGLLVRVAPGMVFHKAVVDRSVQILADYLKSHPGITVSEFRKLLGTSRKYALPLLQHFDSAGITVRDGDIRKRGPGLASTA